jgi:NADP-dependent 3-hydroxy acid dehydrogenase YdfG
VKIPGSHAVITGTTGGLGQAISRRLHADGARLTLSARRAEILEPLAAELGAQVIAADLADLDSIRRLGEAITEADILVANAGLEAADDLVDLDPDAITQIGSRELFPSTKTRSLPANAFSARSTRHPRLQQ